MRRIASTVRSGLKFVTREAHAWRPASPDLILFSGSGTARRRGAAADVADQCVTATFDGVALSTALAHALCASRGIQPGMSPQAVERLLGEPSDSCWSYTSSPGNRRYRRRAVCFAHGCVDEIVRRWE